MLKDLLYLHKKKKLWNSIIYIHQSFKIYCDVIMGVTIVVDRYYDWYQKSLNGITDMQLWNWYRISTRLNLEDTNHPYDILAEKLARNLEELETIKVK